MNQRNSVIGVDMGGTKIAVGRIESNRIAREHRILTPANEPEGVVVQALIAAIEHVLDDSCQGIGVGVPSLVDTERGIVYDVPAIPAWTEVHLKDRLESHFHKPVFVNNDSNCFALGEKHFGKGKGFRHLVGMTLGTGMGAGIIVDHHLYSGSNCGAGEFGSLPYKESTVEDYCSGRFFTRNYGIEGHVAYSMAARGDAQAGKMFAAFGANLGNAVKMIMFSVDPEAIIIGGSISEAFPLFRRSMLDSMSDFPYGHAIRNMTIEKSDLDGAALLGAGALALEGRYP
jgi:glucokinase